MNNAITDRKAFSPEDMSLALKLIARGPDHAKFMRLMGASFSIKAPRYWWIEFATYRAGVESVSESTMHRKLSEPFHENDFECDIWTPTMNQVLIELNWFRENVRNGKAYLEDLKARLPEGFLQTRDLSMSYQALRYVYFSRHNHKLPHWREFCRVIEGLPLAELLCTESAVITSAKKEGAV